MSRRIICWRHGQTVWNVENRFQGHSDIPLDATGLAQAERAATLLASLRPTRIVSSDLIRAYGTARALGSATGLEVATDKELRERSGGAWEGLTGAEIKERFPEEYGAWEPPGGELVTTVAHRVSAAITRWVSTLDGDGPLVLVSHGAAIRLGMARLLGIPEDLWPILGPLGNCAWSVLEQGRKGWRLIEHNAGTLPEPVHGDDAP